MYGNPTFDCDGAQARAQCRQLATVVTISGEIDGANVDCVSQYASRFVLPEKPFVLDLSGVNAFANHGVSLLYAVEDAANAAKVEWALISSQPVTKVLRELGIASSVPFAGSVPEALEHFADVLDARRRLLPLFRKTA